jgi:hypothetical protein
MNEIRQVVTHYSSNLGEAAHEEKVRVAGMVTGIRPHQTKTGKMMAWVMLEDLAGNIELVVFPRTWEKYQFALEIGGVIVAEGKVDAQSNPAKVLVDNIRTQIKLTEPAQIPLQPVPDPSTGLRQAQPGGFGRDRKPGAASKRVAESAPAYRPAPAKPQTDDWDEGAPPPPENPPEWDSYTPAVTPALAVPDQVVHKVDLPEEQGAVSGLPLAVSDIVPGGDQQSAVSGQPSAVSATAALEILPLEIENRKSSIDPPVATLPPAQVLPPDPRLSGAADDDAPRMVTVILRPSGDPERDIRRITRLHGTFISFPGRDRFAFHVFEDGRGHLVEFPNDTTRVCAELMAKIKDAVGEENIRVEPILYQ